MKSKYLSIAALLALGACGGQGSNNALPLMKPTTAPVTASSNVTFTVDISQAPATSAAKRAFISPSTRSVTFAVQGNVLGTLDTSAQSSACTVQGNSRHCSIGLNAPTGNDTFVVTAYDQTGGTGNVLGKGSVSQSVGSGQAATVAVDLGGVVSSLRVALSPAVPPAGTAASISVVLQALDADGHTIVGPYDKTITLADADTSGTTSLSSTSVTGSSQNITLNYTGAPFISTEIGASAPGVAASAVSFAPLPALVTDNLIDGISTPDDSYASVPGAEGFCVGPDGNFWVAATTAGAIMKVTQSGNVTPYFLPNAATNAPAPQYIVVGKDGAMWFTETYGNNIGRITTSGQITEYPLPTAYADPIGLTAAPDGSLWFTENQAGAIGKIDMQGHITEYPLANFALPQDIAIGTDGNLWVDEPWTGVEVISLTGAHIATYPLSEHSNPWGIAPGSDGNMWVGDLSTNNIYRITPAGVVTSYTTPSPNSGPVAFASGPDGNIWFAESGGGNPSGAVGYINPKTGRVAEVQIGISEHVRDLLFTKNGMLWYSAFVDRGPSDIGEIAY